ncbi:MAG: VOC family protein [Hyphomicrobiaceae bacterium]
MSKTPVMRVARPTDNLLAIKRMYVEGLGLSVLGEFAEHDGFDGVILGFPNQAYHIEFTSRANHTFGFAPSADHLLVFYQEDDDAWKRLCAQMLSAGFVHVKSFNPYWDVCGITFADVDGYRVVIQNTAWPTEGKTTRKQPPGNNHMLDREKSGAVWVRAPDEKKEL